MSLLNIIAMLFMAAGMVFCVITVIGYHRLPDFYARCHASGLSETLALMLICIGLILYSGLNITSVKLVILAICVYVCNPIGSHAICNAAFKCGHPMVTKDDLEKKEVDSHADSAD